MGDKTRPLTDFPQKSGVRDDLLGSTENREPHQRSDTMLLRKGFRAALPKALRRSVPIILCVIYVTLGVASLYGVDNPLLAGVLHIAVGIAHLLG
jgi:hypothetical protein